MTAWVTQQTYTLYTFFTEALSHFSFKITVYLLGEEKKKKIQAAEGLAESELKHGGLGKVI